MINHNFARGELSYDLQPALIITEGATAAWTVQTRDGEWSVQVARRLERLASGRWRLSFAFGKHIEFDREQDLQLFLYGLLAGRTLC